MESVQTVWTPDTGWKVGLESLGMDDAGLVFVFCSGSAVKNEELFKDISRSFPSATTVGCSTAGEVNGERVYDESVSVTAVRFSNTEVRSACGGFSDGRDVSSVAAGLAGELSRDNLVHVLVFSDGLNVNGTELARAITGALPRGVSVSGGLAGDGSRFAETYILGEKGFVANGLVLLGFYSESLEVGCGSIGGWDPFGPKRLVTRSKGSKLYELDNKSALELYKEYLGDFAADLPAAGLHFPLSMCLNGTGQNELVRTILGVSEEEKSMTFAGDVPEGVYVRFMKANKDRLVDGAQNAAGLSISDIGGKAELALCVSCVGRKLVLGQRVEEEVEAAISVIGEQAAVTGYYSYGELAPLGRGGECLLHNQTMTITVFRESK